VQLKLEGPTQVKQETEQFKQKPVLLKVHEGH
jgi:hypothetical protein